MEEIYKYKISSELYECEINMVIIIIIILTKGYKLPPGDHRSIGQSFHSDNAQPQTASRIDRHTTLLEIYKLLLLNIRLSPQF